MENSIAAKADVEPFAHLAVLAADEARQRFGFEGLRPHQAEVLAHVLGDRDCLAVLPTGSGKTLCYALPALVRDGLVLVVSPLIALIRDQARKFAAAGIPAVAFDSLQSADEKGEGWREIESGRAKILLVSPERLARPDFRARLKAQNVQLVAIDEAHCISQWGSHFRPDYRFLGDYLDDFSTDAGPVQKLAVTATATSRVREDIAKFLRLDRPATVWADFARKNLKLKVVRADKVAEQLTAILQSVLASDGPGIVYVPTRKSAREVHRMLVDAGVAATVYHGGLPPAERNAAQRLFMEGGASVVVATHAFGMGIDKADIRFVHHAGLPGSVEQYVQEIGRAGRDGKAAQCHLVYGPRDYYVQKFMIDRSYPTVVALKALLVEARRAIEEGMGYVSAQAFLRRASGLSDLPPQDAAEALEILCREGLLAELKSAHGGRGDGAEVLIADGNPALDFDVWRDYPLRQVEAMAKLDAMRAFVALTDNRAQYLDDYFRK